MQPESVPSRKTPIMIGINAKLASKILKATVLALDRLVYNVVSQYLRCIVNNRKFGS